MFAAGYDFFIDGVLLPLAPSELIITVNGKNETVTLINGGEANITKLPGLSDVKFTCVFPGAPLPSIRGLHLKPKFYLKKLESLKLSKEPFQFIVSRFLPDWRPLHHTNMKATLESYTVKESASEGFDTVVDIQLKQWRHFGAQRGRVTGDTAIAVEPSREALNSPAPKNKPVTYTVKSGDSLWSLAKKFYGDGSLYGKIAEANPGKVNNPSLIAAGEQLVIPV